jgi:hypothetical protein
MPFVRAFVLSVCLCLVAAGCSRTSSVNNANELNTPPSVKAETSALATPSPAGEAFTSGATPGDAQTDANGTKASSRQMIATSSSTPIQFDSLESSRYVDHSDHYSINYDAHWRIVDDSPIPKTMFYLTSSYSGPLFSVAVNDEGYGLPTLAYYAAVQGQPLRPLASNLFRDFSQLSDVCTLRDDDHIYIQREDVVYTLSVSSSSNAENPTQVSQEIHHQFDSWAASFDFVEPWSDKGVLQPSPPIPVPCWR